MTTATDLLSLSWHHIGDPSPYGSWEEAPALCDPRLAFSVFFWTETSDVIQFAGTTLPLPGWVTAPAASIITGTTLDFFFYFQSPCFSPWFFSLFQCSFFLMSLATGMATSIITAVLCFLSTTTLSLLVGQQMLLCVELVVPQDVSLVLFNHLWLFLPLGLRDLWESIWAQTYTIPATWLCLSVHAVPACILASLGAPVSQNVTVSQ